MKTLSANLQTHLDGSVLTLATCIMLERTDGTRLGFTDHWRDLTVDMGTGEGDETFTSVGGFSASAHGADIGLAADNQDFTGVIDSSLISETDLKAGRYAGCQVWVFQVNYTAISDGLIKLDYGEVAKVTIRDQTWQAQVLDLAALMGQTVGNKFGRYCRATLGDTRCGVQLNPADWQASTSYAVGDAVKATTYDGRRYVCTTAGTSHTSEPTWDTTVGNTTTETGGVAWETFNAWTKEGSVDADSSDKQQFVDAGLTDADDYFRFGVLTWTSGLNNGLSEDVKSSTAAGAFVLKFPMPFAVQAGDTFTITAGCNHLLKLPADEWGTAYTGDCRAKFDNAAAFDGEPDIPGDDKVIKGPL